MNLWRLLADYNLLPNKAKIKHLLWELYFMKVYPTEPPSCSVLGGSRGAIDPKTMRKWVWMLIQKIAKLGLVVVSAVATHCCFYSHPSNVSHCSSIIVSSFTRLFLTAGKRMTAGTTAS